MSRTSAGSKTLAAKYYTSQDVYDSETTSIFAHSWLCVGRADEMPAVGDYLLYDVDDEFWDETNRQDWQVCELSQQGVSSRAYQPGPYANEESLLVAFDEHYLGCVGRSHAP